MGLLSERLVAQIGGHTLEVHADNHVLRGLIYKLYFDGEELADAKNYLKVPTERKLEARIEVDGVERHVVVAITQRMLSCDFSMTIDGEQVPLESVE